MIASVSPEADRELTEGALFYAREGGVAFRYGNFLTASSITSAAKNSASSRLLATDASPATGPLESEWQRETNEWPAGETGNKIVGGRPQSHELAELPVGS